MRVVILSDRVPPSHAGGAEVAAWRIASLLADLGHELHVVTATTGSAEEELRAGIRIHKVHSAYPERFEAWLSPWNPQVVAPLGRLLKRLAPDVVHVHNVHRDLSYASLGLASRLGIPTVFTSHDLMPIAYGKVEGRLFDSGSQGLGSGVRCLPPGFERRRMRFRYNPWRRALVRRALRRHARVRTCVSEAQRRVLEAHDLGPFEVLYHGVDLRRSHADTASVEKLELELDLRGRRVVLFAGRIGVAKGARQLGAALRSVATRVPEVCLLLLSRRPEDAQLVGSDLFAAGHIRFGGWREGESLAAAYARADVVAVPSLIFEPAPLTALEAMAAGRPVLGTRFGGLPEYVLDGETGLVVDPNDVIALADALERLLVDEVLRARLGRAGRKRAEDCFSAERHVSRTLEVYAQAIAAGRSLPV